MFAGTDVLRPLEHHVLEEMREAGSARTFVLGADGVADGDGKYRGVVVF